MDTKGKPTLGSKGPISNSSSSIKSNIIRHFEGENHHYVVAKVRVVVHDKKSNQSLKQW